MRLEPESVARELPPLHRQEDAGLFLAETTRTMPGTETGVVSGNFLPAGWHSDLPGWKGQVKGILARISTRRESFVPAAGRTPLIATDRFSNGYFHWVTEVLPRLWWLRESLGTLDLVLPAFAARYPYMAESLAVFSDLRFQILPPGVRWHLEGALLVPATAPTGNYRPALTCGVRDAWRQAVKPKAPHRKLYVSRSQAARRRVANEAEVRRILEDRGYETVHLEGMAFNDQVRLLAETSDLISNHGAGLTNMLFMAPGTRVTEIRLEGDSHNNCYFSLARAGQLDYRYVLASAVNTGEAAHTADLIVPPGALP